MEEPPKGRRNRVDGEYRLAIGWAQGSTRWVCGAASQVRTDGCLVTAESTGPHLGYLQSCLDVSRAKSPLPSSFPRCRCLGVRALQLRIILRFDRCVLFYRARGGSAFWMVSLLVPAFAEGISAHSTVPSLKPPSRFPSHTRNCAQRQ